MAEADKVDKPSKRCRVREQTELLLSQKLMDAGIYTGTHSPRHAHRRCVP